VNPNLDHHSIGQQPVAENETVVFETDKLIENAGPSAYEVLIVELK